MAKQSSPVVRVNNARHMVVTQMARLSFPALFTPKAFDDKPGEKKEYSAHLIFDSMEDLQKPWDGKKTKTPSLTKAIFYAKTDQFGEKSKWPNFPYPNVLKGDEYKDKDGKVRNGYEGKVFVKVKSGEKFPPKIVLANGAPATEQDVYGGCYVQAQILVRPYVAPNKGVSLRLLGIRKVKDGEKFGAGQDLFEYDEVEESHDWGEGETVGTSDESSDDF